MIEEDKKGAKGIDDFNVLFLISINIKPITAPRMKDANNTYSIAG